MVYLFMFNIWGSLKTPRDAHGALMVFMNTPRDLGSCIERS